MAVSKLGIKTSNPAPTNFVSLPKIIFLHPIGAYWFLHSLLIISMISIIINSIIKNKNVLLFYIFTISIFLLLDLLELVSIRTSLYFILGYILKELTLRKIKISIYYIFILLPISLIFYLKKGIYSATENMADLENGKSKLAELFIEVNEIITEIRLKSN